MLAVQGPARPGPGAPVAFQPHSVAGLVVASPTRDETRTYLRASQPHNMLPHPLRGRCRARPCVTLKRQAAGCRRRGATARPSARGEQMSSSDLAIVAAAIFIWGALSARLERFDVTAPITFVLAGLLLTHGPLAPLGFAPSTETVKTLAEITLVLVLFSDASRVGLRDLRTDMGLCVRLLAVGLPLTIGLGTLLALPVVGGTNLWLALLVGAALAPTDAALGAGMMVNRAVPVRIRRLINVESGLNDGIATPFVLIALAGVQHSEHTGGLGPAGAAAAELALGVAIGVVVGGVGGYVVKVASDRGWVAGSFAGSAVLALAVCAYACALA